MHGEIHAGLEPHGFVPADQRPFDHVVARLGEYMADAGVPVVDHELHAIGVTALIAMAIKRRLRA
jgi:hypothetical protein